jgi:hypothetical protein
MSATLVGSAKLERQVVKDLHASRPDEVSARLVARERCLVDEGDARTSACQHQSGDAPRRACADDEHIEVLVGHRPFLL